MSTYREDIDGYDLDSYPYIDDLKQLIQWLAMPWSQAGNLPMFATELPDGRPLDTGIKLKALYESIVGAGGHEGQGAYRQCPECRQWYVHYPGSDRKRTDHEIEEMAREIRASGVV